MKAFLNDGKGLGSDHGAVTKDYKTFGGLFRYAILPFAKSHVGRTAQQKGNYE